MGSGRVSSVSHLQATLVSLDETSLVKSEQLLFFVVNKSSVIQVHNTIYVRFLRGDSGTLTRYSTTMTLRAKGLLP